MKAGRLRHRVTIQARNEEDNGRGGRRVPPGQEAWRNVATAIAAEVIALRGDEALVQNVQRSVQLYRVTVRARRGITTAHRILWGEVVMNIRSAPPPTDRTWLVMTCEAGVAG